MSVAERTPPAEAGDDALLGAAVGARPLPTALDRRWQWRPGSAWALSCRGSNDWLDELRIGTVSLPIALGLLLMMYPVLAKVRYEELGRLRGERGLFGASLVLNWLVGPALMFALAWIFLADQPEYRTGVIIVGLARCIAMVLVWNDLARGDREGGGGPRGVNSLFQIAAYSLLGWFYLTLLPGWLGLDTQGFEVSIWEVARTVLIFLGIPLTRGLPDAAWSGSARQGREWFEGRFLPRIAPITLYGLLFTIVLLFAIQGDAITDEPLDVARIAVPLLVYFVAHVRDLASCSGKAIGLAYAGRCRSPSPRRATTSSSRSRLPWASSAPPRARRWPESSAR